MKKLIFPFIVMACLLMTFGCSTKFNVAAPYKNITVIYGFLDRADTAHYIRIEKAFLDQNKSALTMAQVPDSSFYASLNVRIMRYDYTGIFKDSIILNKVDLTLEGYPKQPGIFFTAPNYAYKFKGLLDDQYIYRIKVTNFISGETDSADAPIITDDSASFTVLELDNFSLSKAGIDFSSSSINKSYRISGSYTPASGFNFEGQQNGPAYIAQAIIRFNWLDSNTATHTTALRSYDYNLGFQPVSSNSFDFEVVHPDLYNAVADAMIPAPANTVRLIGRCNLFVYLSTYDYYLYQQSSLTQGTGLTGGEIEPVFTNIKGANALGLYTSEGVRSGLETITINTVDSLMANPLTQGANIVGTDY